MRSSCMYITELLLGLNLLNPNEPPSHAGFQSITWSSPVIPGSMFSCEHDCIRASLMVRVYILSGLLFASRTGRADSCVVSEPYSGDNDSFGNNAVLPCLFYVGSSRTPFNIQRPTFNIDHNLPSVDCINGPEFCATKALDSAGMSHFDRRLMLSISRSLCATTQLINLHKQACKAFELNWITFNHQFHAQRSMFFMQTSNCGDVAAVRPKSIARAL